MHLTTAALPLLSFAAALRSSGNGQLAQPAIAPKRVAIIGAGAAGSSAAYHLAQFAQDSGIPLQIDVFERDWHIGGRSTTINPWSDSDQAVELGASIFVDVNHILVNATKAFNLSTNNRENLLADIPEVGIWNGKEIVFTMNEGGWWDLAKLFWRYGYAPVKANKLMRETVDKFLQMYERPLFPWNSLSDVVQLVGLTEATGLTGEQYMQNKGISPKFANEIVQASTRVNYASNLGTIHGVEAMVCLATNGAMSIAGGNWRIFEHMLSSSDSISTHLNNTITRISKQADGSYNLTTIAGRVSSFDEVILAAPLQFSNLAIDPAPEHTPEEIPYVKLHVTHFATPHKLDPSAFGLEADKPVPEYVLTTLQVDEEYGSKPNVGRAGFFSISIVSSGVNVHGSKPRSEYIYKIFSPKRIDHQFLSRVLGLQVSKEEAEKGDVDGTVSWINHWEVHSYPYEYPRVTFDEIKLDEGLWYTSAIESFISTMETSALSGKNVAQLIVNGWNKQSGESSDGEGLKTGANWDFKPLLDNGQRPMKDDL
ncbi:prenylcysteine oxidase-like protein 1 precursor [Paraphaeosphaeria sporulosa]|uniref:Prenylcysteine oxidase-like protein 1 n=1 Tax=Paraphaeosphaeria sporulosa TaxID=1460663 RepID=A0A177C4H4_9PLEO|nr:prenylcysteine oxidase-like protein 1 precursor [Paraphaeosphaeria sporulosa]OAG02533.1 prenylcysteine oxidase-like protein 1 precursor [Paraphaeosphaeria sporulosa]